MRSTLMVTIYCTYLQGIFAYSQKNIYSCYIAAPIRSKGFYIPVLVHILIFSPELISFDWLAKTWSLTNWEFLDVSFAEETFLSILDF